jgi:hypothetical protein
MFKNASVVLPTTAKALKDFNDNGSVSLTLYSLHNQQYVS